MAAAAAVPSFKDALLVYFFTLGTTMIPILLVVVTMLFTYSYPTTGLCGIILPYYTFTHFFTQPQIKDGSHWPEFSRNFWPFQFTRRYLQMQLLTCKELADADTKNREEEGRDPQFIFAVFPHGVNSDFRVVMDGMLPQVVPNTAAKTRTLVASVLFRIPVVREICLWTGCMDARRSVAEQLLARGRSLLILPGGQAEQLRTISGKEQVYLKQRKGFVKIAMKHRVPIVPVYVFGCSDFYRTSSALLSLRLGLVKTLGISIPLAWGLWGSWICPRAIPTTVCFGKPLQLAKTDTTTPKGGGETSPTISAEELDDGHQKFIDALQELFEHHKQKLGYGDRTLEVI